MSYLGRELARLEQEDPAVRRASKSLNAAGELILKIRRERQRADAAEAKLDELARALAKSELAHADYIDGIGEVLRCNSCDEESTGMDDSHTPDCAYVWAVEHVAALGDQ